MDSFDACQDNVIIFCVYVTYLVVLMPVETRNIRGDENHIFTTEQCMCMNYTKQLST